MSNSEAWVDQECPTPIQWPQTRAYILRRTESQDAEIARLTRERDALQATVAAKWSYRLTTPPPPDPPGISYPNLSETYKLEVIDTGHSERILLLESKELSDRIKQLEATVEKCRALYELAWAECLAWRKYDIESCEYACDPPTKEPEAHDAARQAAERAKGVE